MIKKNNVRIQITLTKKELKKLNEATKSHLYYLGMTKTQIITDLIRSHL